MVYEMLSPLTSARDNLIHVKVQYALPIALFAQRFMK